MRSFGLAHTGIAGLPGSWAYGLPTAREAITCRSGSLELPVSLAHEVFSKKKKNELGVEALPSHRSVLPAP